MVNFFNQQKVYKLMKDLTSGYNKMIRPGYFEKETGVGIELYILGIPNVDTEYMELSLDMYFRQVDSFLPNLLERTVQFIDFKYDYNRNNLNKYL